MLEAVGRIEMLRKRVPPGRGGCKQPPRESRHVYVPEMQLSENCRARDIEQEYRVECLMLKGIRHQHQLMKLLDIADYRQIKRYMANVRSRWEIVGNPNQRERQRGRTSAALDLLDQELWSEVSSAEDAGTRIATLKAILKNEKFRGCLLCYSRSIQ